MKGTSRVALSFVAVALGLTTVWQVSAVSRVHAQASTSTSNVISVGMPEPFGQSNLPYLSHSTSTRSVLRDQFATLLRLGTNLAPKPYLVSKWWYTDGGTRLYMTLSPHAIWSNGQPITSADVQLTVNYLASPTYNSALQGDEGYRVLPIVGSQSAMSGASSAVSGFHAVNNQEFYFQLRNPNASALINDFAGLMPLPASVLSSVPFSAWSQNGFFTQPTVGSGPFLLTNWSSGEAVMRANARFVLGVPKSSGLAVRIVPQSAVLGFLSSGQLNLYDGLPLADVGALAKGGGQSSAYRIASYPGNHYTFLGWTDNVAPFQNVAFRRAVEYAINRLAVIQAAVGGYGMIENGPIPPDSSWYDTALNGTYPYNPQTARNTLIAAGFNIGGNAWLAQPNGKPIQLTIAYAENDPYGQKAAQVIAQDLQAVAIDAKAQAFSVQQIVDSLTNHTGLFQGFVMGWHLGPDPSPANLWKSTATFNAETFDWTQSTDPNVMQSDQLIARQDDANSEAPSHRQTLLNQWQQLINARMPINFLYDQDRLAAVNSHLHGVKWSGVRGAIDPWLWYLS